MFPSSWNPATGLRMTLTPGTRLGPYEIVAPIGAGGMGEVYRARDTRLGREVAIKQIRPEIAHQPGQSIRFEREARLLAQLNHPNVAVLHGLEERDGVCYLVMELVPGETLAERLAREPLAVPAALDVARQITLALEAAHEKGIIHRDLKPANIKLTPRGLVKLLDFGLARALEIETPPNEPQIPTLAPDPTRSGVIIGTPQYMSPEQARGQPLDARTDVWSFGCILYEMLAGRRPFEAPSAVDVLAAVLERPIDFAALPRSLPGPVRQVVRQCLERDVRRRLPDISQARRLLEQPPAAVPEVAEPLPPLVLPADAPTERRSSTTLLKPRRRRWPFLLIGALVLTTACCGTGTYGVYQFFTGLSLPWRPARNSVAVLPFDTGNPFNDGPYDRFADALAADVTTRLTSSPGLRVTPHRSAAEYRRSRPQTASALLNVRWIVTGTVENAEPDRVRIRVELVDASNDVSVWTTTFTEQLDRAEPRLDSALRRERLAGEIALQVRERLAAVK